MIGKIATSIRTENGFTIVRYHNTDVVKYTSGLIALDTGGYFTATTKRRMNEASVTFGLHYHVYQAKRAWFCSYRGFTLPFVGNVLTLNRTIGGAR